MRETLANVSGLAWKVWRRDLDVYLTTWRTNFLPPLPVAIDSPYSKS